MASPPEVKSACRRTVRSPAGPIVRLNSDYTTRPPLSGGTFVPRHGASTRCHLCLRHQHIAVDRRAVELERGGVAVGGFSAELLAFSHRRRELPLEFTRGGEQTLHIRRGCIIVEF